MRLALDVRVRQGKYSSFVRVTELLEEAAAAVGLDLELWQGGSLGANILWNPLMDVAPVPAEVRQVLTLHDVSPLLPDPRPTLVRWRRGLRFRKRFREAEAKAIAFSAVSRDVEQLVRRFFPESHVPVSVVPHYPAAGFSPVDIATQNAVLQPLGLQPGMILFVAALRRHKNWEGVFHAWTQLPAALRLAHPLVFAGASGRGTRRLYRLLRRVHAVDVVHVLDAVDDLVLRALYSACSVMVFPSFNEGFGLPPLEAMACGAPVIASNLTAMPEVLGNAAHYVDPWSVDSIRLGMEKLLTSSEDLKLRGKASLARAAHFNACRTGEAMLSLLDGLEKA